MLRMFVYWISLFGLSLELVRSSLTLIFLLLYSNRPKSIKLKNKFPRSMFCKKGSAATRQAIKPSKVFGYNSELYNK